MHRLSSIFSIICSISRYNGHGLREGCFFTRKPASVGLMPKFIVMDYQVWTRMGITFTWGWIQLLLKTSDFHGGKDPDLVVMCDAV
jgi:hypothetical protein